MGLTASLSRTSETRMANRPPVPILYARQVVIARLPGPV